MCKKRRRGGRGSLRLIRGVRKISGRGTDSVLLVGFRFVDTVIPRGKCDFRPTDHLKLFLLTVPLFLGMARTFLVLSPQQPPFSKPTSPSSQARRKKQHMSDGMARRTSSAYKPSTRKTRRTGLGSRATLGLVVGVERGYRRVMGVII